MVDNNIELAKLKNYNSFKEKIDEINKRANFLYGKSKEHEDLKKINLINNNL